MVIRMTSAALYSASRPSQDWLQPWQGRWRLEVADVLAWLLVIMGGGAASALAEAVAALLRPLAASSVVLLSTVSMQAVMVSRATITSQGCEAQNSPWARNRRPIIFAATCCAVEVVQCPVVVVVILPHTMTRLNGPISLLASCNENTHKKRKEANVSKWKHCQY